MEYPETQSLFHYTKSIDTLKSILEHGLEMNFCVEKIGSLFMGIPMICFCDIPLSRTAKHRDSYKPFAIGFSKQKFINRQHLNSILNPVHYITSKVLESNYVIGCKSDNNAIREKGFASDLEGLEKLLNATLDKMGSDFSRSITLGFIKTYHSPGVSHSNYIEREWRVIMPEMQTKDSNVKWFWDEVEYDTWRGDRETTPKPKPSFNHILDFVPQDITHIIVEKEDDIPDLFDFISYRTETIGGLETDYYLKRWLISKITSFERIESDF